LWSPGYIDCWRSVTEQVASTSLPRFPVSVSPDVDGGGGWKDDAGVPHSVIADPAGEVAIQSGAVVSKVVHRGDGMNVTVFGFDAGEGLTEHQAARAAVVQVLSGRLRFTVDGEPVELGPGSWLQMAASTPHSLIASEPTAMLLTLLGA
jgi:quercetin dioxygenase-like cupin family protein